MNKKIFVFLALAVCFELSSAQEADWEIVNLAIRNPGQANPQILSNSILNILRGFAPPTSAPTPAPPVTAAPTAAPITAAPKPCPTCPGACPPPPTVIVSPPAPAPSPVPAPAPVPSPPAPQIIPIYVPAPSPPAPVPAPAPAPIQYYPAPVNQPNQQYIYYQQQQQSPTKPPCGYSGNSIADFLVNVPCPTTTTTKKPIRQIVVKVPCPTTTAKPECECQCCPCNPCPTQKPPRPSKSYRHPKPSRTTTKCPEKHSSEESHEDPSEARTIYKSYDPVMKTYVNAKRSYFSPRANAKNSQSHGEYLWK